MATFRARALTVILCLLILHNTDAYQVAPGSSPVSAPVPKIPAPAPPKAPVPAPKTPAPAPPKAPVPAPKIPAPAPPKAPVPAPKIPAPAPPKAPAPAPKIDCAAACAYRCSKTKRPNLCKRTCGGCCSICNCVPPGTYGNYEACPCYYKLTTRKKNNKVVRKCP